MAKTSKSWVLLTKQNPSLNEALMAVFIGEKRANSWSHGGATNPSLSLFSKLPKFGLFRGWLVEIGSNPTWMRIWLFFGIFFTVFFCTTKPNRAETLTRGEEGWGGRYGWAMRKRWWCGGGKMNMTRTRNSKDQDTMTSTRHDDVDTHSTMQRLKGK